MYYALTRTVTHGSQDDIESDTICISADKDSLREHMHTIYAIAKHINVVKQTDDKIVIRLTPKQEEAPNYIAFTINPYDEPIDMANNTIYAHLRNANKVSIPSIGISQIGAEISTCIKADSPSLVIGLALSIINSASRQLQISIDELMFHLKQMYLDNKSDMENPEHGDDGNDDK